MQESLINAFVSSVEKTFKTMLEMDVKPEQPLTGDIKYAMNGVIGFSGGLKGYMAISFTQQAAHNIINKFLGEDTQLGNKQLMDGVKEFSNIIARNSRKYLQPVHMKCSLPVFMSKDRFQDFYSKEIPIVTIPFQCGLGLFCVKLQFQKVNPLKILVVDDSLTMRRLHINTLKKAGYVHFLEAENGKKGLEVLRENMPVACIILDWSMPVMDGLQFLQQARSEKTYDKVKIFMCTSEGEDACREKAMKAGADDYIIKPFSPETIKQLIG